MKKWKIVWVTVTGCVFCNKFDTFEEMKNWLSDRAEQLKPVCKKITVWELYESEWKIRNIYKKA